MQFRRKIPSFVFGVSIGLLVGVAFFLFKMDAIFTNLKSSLKSDKITIIEQKVNSEDEKSAKEKAKNKERFKIKTGPATKVNYKEIDSIINSDNEINLAVDQLLSSKRVKIIDISNSKGSDSLIANAAGVNPVNSDSYTLEFWKTPLNSKGYRFTKNKILLYGFSDHSNVVLYQYDGRFFIKSFEVIYELLTSSDFQPFVKINNPEIISKLDS